MQHVGDHRPGVFDPEELQEMQNEMDRNAPPGGSKDERENLAIEIIRRKEVRVPAKKPFRARIAGAAPHRAEADPASRSNHLHALQAPA